MGEKVGNESKNRRKIAKEREEGKNPALQASFDLSIFFLWHTLN